MAKKHILMFAASLAILFAGEATAQNIDRVVMSSGSEYEGYIAEQVPGQYITINSNKAILFIDSSSIKNMETISYPVNHLTEPMKSWVAKNLPDKSEVELASMQAGSKSYKNLLILEKGVRVKVLQLAKDSFKVNWKNVVKTSKLSTANSKLHEVVTLKNGKSLSGHIIEQIIGKELRIKQFNGDITSIAFADILSIRTELALEAENLWVHAPLLDKVKLNDGTVLEGFITARVMGSHLYFITPKSNTEREIKSATVAKYMKVVNPDAIIVEEPVVEEQKPEVEEVDTRNFEPTEPEIVEEQTMTRSEKKKAAKQAKAEAEARAEVEAQINVQPQEQVELEPKAQSKKESKSNKAEVEVKSAFVVRVNGIQVTLSDYQEIEKVISKYFTSSNNTIALTTPIKECGKVGQSIQIEIPNSYDISDLKIVLTSERNLGIQVTGSDKDTCPAFTPKDANKSAIGYGTSTSGNNNIITVVLETPGVYALYPKTSDNKYIAFKITE